MSAARSCQTIAQLADGLRRRHPHLAADLDDLTHLAAQIQATYPLAAACINPGDGLRSPDLTGSGGTKGGVSRPTETTALSHLERGRLTVSRCDSLLADAEHALRLALSEAQEGFGGTDAHGRPQSGENGQQTGAPWTLDLPTDGRNAG